MLDERDRRAWADLERRLLDDTAPRFPPAARLSPGRSPTPARWLPYVMAVVVPLPLPAISVMEMRPFVAGLGAIVATTVVLARSAQRGSHLASAVADWATTRFERSEQ
jgi:hypothetical protein